LRCLIKFILKLTDFKNAKKRRDLHCNKEEAIEAAHVYWKQGAAA
jgi:hypothetical protein